MSDIEAIMRTAPVIPVIVIDEVEHAEPLARALVPKAMLSSPPPSLACQSW